MYLQIFWKLTKQKLEQKAKNDEINNPAHYNNFPGHFLYRFYMYGNIDISDLVAAIQDSKKKNQDPFNPAKEILF